MEVQKGDRARAPDPPPSEAHLPSEDEVLTAAQSYAGNLARGVPGPIPTRWALDWFAAALETGRLNARWATVLRLRFEADWLGGHPKACLVQEKNAPANGRSPAQARYEMQKELSSLRARNEARRQSWIEPDPVDEARERELEGMLNHGDTETRR